MLKLLAVSGITHSVVQARNDDDDALIVMLFLLILA